MASHVKSRARALHALEFHTSPLRFTSPTGSLMQPHSDPLSQQHTRTQERTTRYVCLSRSMRLYRDCESIEIDSHMTLLLYNKSDGMDDRVGSAIHRILARDRPNQPVTGVRGAEDTPKRVILTRSIACLAGYYSTSTQQCRVRITNA